MPGLIVHEWIEKRGGSENVVDAMAAAYADATIHCLWNNAPERYPNHAVTESWIARTPLRKSKALALPFMPATWSRTDVSAADFVLVSSHLFAHHVGGRAAADAQKFVYVHSPARYIWAPDLDARGQNPLARAGAPYFRRLDRRVAAHTSRFAANSQFIRARIADAWQQDAAVVYPPVRVEMLQAEDDWRNCLTGEEAEEFGVLPNDFLLGASRFVHYKRLDAVISAGEAAGLPVVLAGGGPQEAELRELASRAAVPVHFVIRPSDAMLFALYQRAFALIFLAVEDFGIMPVEAMSLGTPVLVTSVGGARESVEALGGGIVIDSPDAATLADGIEQLSRLDMPAAAGAAVDAFGERAFAERLTSWTNVAGTVASAGASS